MARRRAQLGGAVDHRAGALALSRCSGMPKSDHLHIIHVPILHRSMAVPSPAGRPAWGLRREAFVRRRGDGGRAGRGAGHVPQLAPTGAGAGAVRPAPGSRGSRAGAARGRCGAGRAGGGAAQLARPARDVDLRGLLSGGVATVLCCADEGAGAGVGVLLPPPPSFPRRHAVGTGKLFPAAAVAGRPNSVIFWRG